MDKTKITFEVLYTKYARPAYLVKVSEESFEHFKKLIEDGAKTHDWEVEFIIQDK